ncbi:hypothetical protein [Thermogutta sp.]|uniref:hypothetical protein n=1 Tax=Thermogutta sp. TaxID=1962930 RepID=UPI0032202E76
MRPVTKFTITGVTPLLPTLWSRKGEVVRYRFERQGSARLVRVRQISAALIQAAVAMEVRLPLFTVVDEGGSPLLSIPISAKFSAMTEKRGLVSLICEVASDWRLEFYVRTSAPDLLADCLRYAGANIGIGGLRLAGYGRFTCQEE